MPESDGPADEFVKIFEMSLDMICVADIQTYRFIRVNPAFTRILGYSEKELLEKPVTAYVYPEDIEATRQVIAKQMEAGIRVVNFENRYLCKNGQYRWLSWVSQPVPEKGITYAIARDITDYKTVQDRQARIQQELVKRNRFIETILDYLPIGLGVNLMDTGEVTYLNRKFEEIYGWSMADFPTVADFFDKVFPDPEHRKNIEERITGDMNSEDPRRMEWEDLEIETKTGEKRIVYGKNIPLAEQNLMISTVQDFTEKKKLEAQVQQARKMEAIGTLAGGIAHDFNNFLGIIIGNISHAMSLCEENRELTEILSDVQEGAVRARHLTQQLLTFARGGAPVKETHNINHLLEESARFVTRGAKAKCNFELAQDLWPVDVDSGQISQVVSNLVINADQAMPMGGTITIRSRNVEINDTESLHLAAGRYIRISIADTGIGIPEQHLTSVFDPYFSTKHKGSGLGLATVYSIVNKHGGHIGAQSRSGTGTQFDIHLPASQKKVALPEERKIPIHQGSGRILVMDDQEPIIKMVERILDRLGYTTISCLDGKDAIHLYRQANEEGSPFDLVVLDLTVPGGMGGAEVIPELLKIDPEARAIASSGYSNDPVMADYAAYGFSGVIPKPYTKQQMAELLNRVLGHGGP